MKLIESKIVIGGPRDGQAYEGERGASAFVERRDMSFNEMLPVTDLASQKVEEVRLDTYTRRYITLGTVRIAYWGHDSMTDSDVLVRLFSRYGVSSESTFRMEGHFDARESDGPHMTNEIAFLDDVMRKRLLGSETVRNAVQVTFDVGPNRTYVATAKLATALRVGEATILTSHLKEALK